LSLDTLGKTLAQEIEKYVTENCPESTLSKISFVGFSIGGVIIRAAIPYLKKYWHVMNNYVSFSSPHLGTMISSNTLVNAGLWLLKKFKKSLSLE